MRGGLIDQYLPVSPHISPHLRNLPWQVRGGLIDQLAENCNASGKQCKIIVSEDESRRNTFLDDTDLRFEAEMAGGQG